MDTKQITDLRQRLSTLTTASEQFVDWYVKALVYGHRMVRLDGNSNERVYLPYSGNDQEFIFRLFRLFASIKYPEFNIDANNLPIIKHLIKIVTDPNEKKGLILHGTVGAGKTALVLVWLDFRVTVLCYGDINKKNIREIEAGWLEQKLTVSTYRPSELVSRVAKEGYSFFDEFGNQSRNTILFIDDIGLATTVTSYGTQINILDQLIYTRYDAFKVQQNLEFCATTNLTTKQLKELMDERAWSRLMEMTSWNEGLLKGEDRRGKANQLKQWPTFKKQRNK